MSKYLILTLGFEKPTREIMQEWKQWFAGIQSHILEQGHLPRGTEISALGSKKLTLDKDAITGYVMIQAKDFEEAESIACACPYVKSTQVYEIKTM